MKITRREAMLTMGVSFGAAATLVTGSTEKANPIVDFSSDEPEDFVVWGQDTIQRLDEGKLDRVCLRRLMFYIDKTIRQDFRKICCSDSYKFFRNYAKGFISLRFADIQKRGGLQHYKIVQYETVNGELRVSVDFMPNRGVEYVTCCYTFSSKGSNAI